MMNPRIDGTTFGSITIAGEAFERDVIIRLNGQVKKRKKNCPRRSMAHPTSSRWPRPSIFTRKAPNG